MRHPRALVLARPPTHPLLHLNAGCRLWPGGTHCAALCTTAEGLVRLLADVPAAAATASGQQSWCKSAVDAAFKLGSLAAAAFPLGEQTAAGSAGAPPTAVHVHCEPAEARALHFLAASLLKAFQRLASASAEGAPSAQNAFMLARTLVVAVRGPLCSAQDSSPHHQAQHVG